jgi:OmpA-OmpF porin, OOP family
MSQHQLINNYHACLKHTFTAALVCTLLAAINPALAENYYVGANFIGQSKSKDTGNAIRDPFITKTGVSPSIDDKGTAWKLFGGYQTNENLGFEVAFIDLGEVKATIAGASASIKSKGVAFSAVGTVPVSNSTGVFGKIGLFSWSTSTPGIIGSAIPSEDGVDSTYGIGAKFQFNKQVGVRLDWDRFKLGDADTDMLSVGILFNFK